MHKVEIVFIIYQSTNKQYKYTSIHIRSKIHNSIKHREIRLAVLYYDIYSAIVRKTPMCRRLPVP